ncbi:hypothetical protein LSTR_LSTR007871 [Laodelphax striatellus]|uniref:SH2 domain-containing adapter protein D n=1 Tax=Laodelphax striatellus TaxID=195883 RepID=A0A482XQE5_LAOST|nr:hypothetical protein LSTR_LSTR007871 [Laodelphax striatellus]
MEVDVRDVPFDMPKLRRRGQSQLADSGSTTSVDLGDLPFDMPKLRRRQRMSLPIASTSSAAASSSSQQEFDHRVSRPGLTLDLISSSAGGASCSGFGMRLDLDETSSAALGEAIDVNIPLEKQGWYHGVITRLEAETVLRSHREGSYLVRNSESSRNDYSLSLKSARGFMHMRIQLCAESGKYILGQFSSPFSTIPDMIQNYTVNRLPIRGAEHMCLLHPVIEQLL